MDVSLWLETYQVKPVRITVKTKLIPYKKLILDIRRTPNPRGRRWPNRHSATASTDIHEYKERREDEEREEGKRQNVSNQSMVAIKKYKRGVEGRRSNDIFNLN